MIVRSRDSVLQLVTQPDHAHLAGRIMEQCVPLASSSRRDAILYAITEHDNGWAEEDAAPTIHAETGQVVDFMNAPLAVRHRVWPRAVVRVADRPWAAALVAQHALTIYDRFRVECAWTAFFADMETARDEYLRRTGLALDDLVADYVFVRLADVISLTFCVGWPADQRAGPWIVRPSGACLIVTPDPFGGKTVPFEITATEISNQVFRSAAELRNALQTGRARTLRGSIVGRQADSAVAP